MRLPREAFGDPEMRLRKLLPGLDWTAINDATVERIEEMINNPKNQIQPVQMEIGKGKQ